MARPRAFKDFPQELWEPYGPYMGIVEENYDGDTIKISLDLGVDHFACVWIRLEDTRAPEMHEEGGPETAEYVRSLAPPGAPCKVWTKKLKSGAEDVTYSRYVGAVHLGPDMILNSMVDEFVREKGYPPGR